MSRKIKVPIFNFFYNIIIAVAILLFYVISLRPNIDVMGTCSPSFEFEHLRILQFGINQLKQDTYYVIFRPMLLRFEDCGRLSLL